MKELIDFLTWIMQDQTRTLNFFLIVLFGMPILSNGLIGIIEALRGDGRLARRVETMIDKLDSALKFQPSGYLDLNDPKNDYLK